jgi:hypothetical protein
LAQQADETHAVGAVQSADGLGITPANDVQLVSKDEILRSELLTRPNCDAPRPKHKLKERNHRPSTGTNSQPKCDSKSG